MTEKHRQFSRGFACRTGANGDEIVRVPQLEHLMCCVGSPRRYCIWSSISEKAFLSLRAFLTSSPVTYGYSPYSRKLGK